MNRFVRTFTLAMGAVSLIVPMAACGTDSSSDAKAPAASGPSADGSSDAAGSGSPAATKLPDACTLWDIDEVGAVFGGTAEKLPDVTGSMNTDSRCALRITDPKPLVDPEWDGAPTTANVKLTLSALSEEDFKNYRPTDAIDLDLGMGAYLDDFNHEVKWYNDGISYGLNFLTPGAAVDKKRGTQLLADVAKPIIAGF